MRIAGFGVLLLIPLLAGARPAHAQECSPHPLTASSLNDVAKAFLDPSRTFAAAAEAAVPGPNDDDDVRCLRNYALTIVYRYPEAKLTGCDDTFERYGLASPTPPGPAQRSVELAVASDVTTLWLETLSPQASPPVVIYRSAGGIAEAQSLTLALDKRSMYRIHVEASCASTPVHDETVDTAKTLEIGQRITADPTRRAAIRVDNQPLPAGKFLLASEQHELSIEGRPDCTKPLGTYSDIDFADECWTESKKPPEVPQVPPDVHDPPATYALGVFARVDFVPFSDVGDLVAGGTAQWRPHPRFWPYIALGGLSTGGLDGGIGGVGVAVPLTGIFELGPLVELAYVKISPPTLGDTWIKALHPQLQARVGGKHFGVQGTFGGFYIFDKNVRDAVQTKYWTVGLGAEWRWPR